MRPAQIGIGERFGRLVVLSQGQPSRSGDRQFLCRCDCGVERLARASHLRKRLIQSCGCLRNETTAARRTTHGHTKQSHPNRVSRASAEYASWSGVIQRCTNAKNAAFANYGGRGIRVCDRWLHSFAAFLADVGPRPSTQHSIDRINNDGNYEPGNVRWATDCQQARNRRSTRLLTHDGQTCTLTEWAHRLGIDPTTLHYRLANWPLSDALH